MESTYGQKLIGVDFAATDAVSKVKQNYADALDRIIDGCEGFVEVVGEDWESGWTKRAQEHRNRAALAIRDAIAQLEFAAMLEVKSMTQGRRLDTDIRLGRNQEAT